MTNKSNAGSETSEQREFRQRARSWLKGRLPPRVQGEPYMDWDNKELVARDRQIQRALWDGGLAGITLPTAYGGLGLDQHFAEIFYEEAEPYRLPWHFGNAFNVVIPALLAHASQALKTRYIPAILRGEHLWCQLLSEPTGGSDLAGVTTRAELRGDKWVLNGSKVWTTGGQDCDMGICLARTDPALPKHAGLTMFAVDMKSPGITITPLTLLEGTRDFCQEFFDDVEVPADHVIGEPNDGWSVARTQLAAEQAGMARGWYEGLEQGAEEARIELSSRYVDMLRALNLDEDFHARQLVGEAFVIDAVSKLTTRRVAMGIRLGTLPHTAGALSSLMAAQSDVRRTQLLSELHGPVGVCGGPGSEAKSVGMARVCIHRIGGGTTETQCNLVAERHLGLPREPSDDNSIPFNQRKINSPRGA